LGVRTSVRVVEDDGRVFGYFKALDIQPPAVFHFVIDGGTYHKGLRAAGDVVDDAGNDAGITRDRIDYRASE